MKFGVPWSVKGIRPEARETAKQAARRSGVSLGEWLNSVILQQAGQDSVEPYVHGDDDTYGHELGSVHRRLDDLTHRIEQLAHSGPAAYAPRRARGGPDQVADLIGRLDRRLDQLANEARPMAPPLAPAMPQPMPIPTTHLPPGLDRAVAEIAARRRALNGEPAQPPAAMAAHSPAPAPAPMPAPAPAPLPMRAELPAQDLSGLEDQLRRITDQIETLRKPGVEEAINALRDELGEIGHALNEAMPRRAIETIEQQIAGLSQRIAEGRQAGVDQGALTGLEHGLAEVRDALRSLTPAENLVGFNEAVAGLAHKIDLIVAQKDPATLQQLENAITTLRGMAAHVASNDTVSQLAAEVQALGEKVDFVAHAAGSGDALNSLEQRVASIADALAERAQSGTTVPPRLEALVQSLTDKIEQIQSSRGDNVAMGHLEDRIVNLVQKLDASESRLGQLEAIERGLGDLLVHIEDMRSGPQAGLRAETTPGVDELKHDIARTQDALEAVHGTLGHVVDRLAMIEQEIRGENRARPAAEAPAPPMGKLAVRAVSEAPVAPLHLPPATPLQMPAPPTASEPWVAPEPQVAHEPPPQPAAPRRRAVTSLPIAPDLPPDQPLEPGSGRPQFSARIAASEAALGGVGPAPDAIPGGKSSFIAAARRAAQAALKQRPNVAPPAAEPTLELEDGAPSSLRTKLMKRVKTLFIAASIIAIVVGSVQIAGNFFNLHNFGTNETAKTGKADADKTDTTSDAGVQDQAKLAANPSARSAVPTLAAPLTPDALAIKTPLSLSDAGPNAPPLFNPPALGAPPASSDDITGSIPDDGNSAPAPSGENLPLALGGARLRSAALAGDPDAAYEVAVRFADGHGVPVNLREAAHWFALAARHGLAPAQFRYASMLEKGQGVKKDLTLARQLYLAAASKGHAKAMHNLAVLYAEGIDGKPDYATAVKWFRQAALHGIADSQYNLGVLTARGLGTEKNFADSYKWFALAAAQGDQESARKRDEIAAQLDPKELAAARQWVMNFKAEPQPQAAIAVPKPRGGWDSADSAAPAPVKPRAPAPRQQPLPPDAHAPLSLGSFTAGNR
jgi:localization factor PodJL